MDHPKNTTGVGHGSARGTVPRTALATMLMTLVVACSSPTPAPSDAADAAVVSDAQSGDASLNGRSPIVAVQIGAQRQAVLSERELPCEWMRLHAAAQSAIATGLDARGRAVGMVIVTLRDRCAIDSETTARTLVVIGVGGLLLSPGERAELWDATRGGDLRALIALLDEVPDLASLRDTPSRRARLEEALIVAARDVRGPLVLRSESPSSGVTVDPRRTDSDGLTFGTPRRSSDRRSIDLPVGVGDGSEVKIIVTASGRLYLKGHELIDYVPTTSPNAARQDASIRLPVGTTTGAMAVVAPALFTRLVDAISEPVGASREPPVSLDRERDYSEAVIRSLFGFAYNVLIAVGGDVFVELLTQDRCARVAVEVLVSRVTAISNVLIAEPLSATTLSRLYDLLFEPSGWEMAFAAANATTQATNCIASLSRFRMELADIAGRFFSFFPVLFNATQQAWDIFTGPAFAVHTVNLCAACPRNPGEPIPQCSAQGGALVCPGDQLQNPPDAGAPDSGSPVAGMDASLPDVPSSDRGMPETSPAVTITLTSPRSPGNQVVGGEITVSWTSTGLSGGVRVLVERPTGLPLEATTTGASDGSHRLVIGTDWGTGSGFRICVQAPSGMPRACTDTFAISAPSTVRCSDGRCEGGETCSTCPADCPCAVPTLTLTSPRAVGDRVIGDVVRVSWTSTGLPGGGIRVIVERPVGLSLEATTSGPPSGSQDLTIFADWGTGSGFRICARAPSGAPQDCTDRFAIAAPATCTGAGRRVCQGSCVDTNTDPANCGACGIACSAAQACSGATCTATCSGPNRASCGGACVDTGTSLTHCGRCDRPCVISNGVATCASGVCRVASCSAGYSDCDGEPSNGCETDLRVSGSHCGRCGNPCSLPNAAAICRSSACVIGSCLAGYGDCDGSASNGCEVNTSTSSAHCSRCANACAGGGACVSGTCVPTCTGANRALCGGACVDTSSDVRNCADCGRVCPSGPNGTPQCAGSQCSIICSSGFGNCDSVASNGCEVPLDTPANCGACARACSLRNAVPACVGASCVVGSCAAGFGDCDGQASNGCETDLRVDPAHCGTCATNCEVANGTPSCVASTCGIASCGTGFHRCGGACVSNASTSTCGTLCAPCPAPSNGAATCDGGSCGFVCNNGYVVSGGSCVLGPAGILPPRLLGPMSTSAVSSQRPVLRWMLAPDTDGAYVDLCRDRACSVVLTSFNAGGGRGNPSIDLPPGVVFWRARGRVGSTIGTTASPTWQFSVPYRSAPIGTSWGTSLDVNGDGLSDVIAGSSPTDTAYLYLGRSGGLASPPSAVLSGPRSSLFGYWVSSAGDTNGDGVGDVLVGAPDAARASVYLGATGGLATTPAVLAPPSGSSAFAQSGAGVGDINGDGYGDVVVGGSGTIYVFLGSSTGLGSSPVPITGRAGTTAFGRAVAGAGDVNGDGYADVIVGTCNAGCCCDNTADVFLGSATGLALSSTVLSRPRGGLHFGTRVSGVGDLNGDGYSDVAVNEGDSSLNVYLGSATGVSSGAIAAQLSGGVATIRAAGDLDADGFSDLVIGNGNSTWRYQGVTVYFGNAAGSGFRSLVLNGPNAFGATLAAGGDTNGDRISDLFVGTTSWVDQTSRPVQVYLGGSALTPAPSLGPPVGSIAYGIGLAM